MHGCDFKTWNPRKTQIGSVEARKTGKNEFLHSSWRNILSITYYLHFYGCVFTYRKGYRNTQTRKRQNLPRFRTINVILSLESSKKNFNEIPLPLVFLIPSLFSCDKQEKFNHQKSVLYMRIFVHMISISNFLEKGYC